MPFSFNYFKLEATLQLDIKIRYSNTLEQIYSNASTLLSYLYVSPKQDSLSISELSRMFQRFNLNFPVIIGSGKLVFAVCQVDFVLVFPLLFDF